MWSVAWLFFGKKESSAIMDDINVDIPAEVHRSVVAMYDRYFQVAQGNSEHHDPASTAIMTYGDFINQLLVRGMYEYNNDLIKAEKASGRVE